VAKSCFSCSLHSTPLDATLRYSLGLVCFSGNHLQMKFIGSMPLNQTVKLYIIIIIGTYSD
jgi:hypothetical protein